MVAYRAWILAVVHAISSSAALHLLPEATLRNTSLQEVEGPPARHVLSLDDAARKGESASLAACEPSAEKDSWAFMHDMVKGNPMVRQRHINRLKRKGKIHNGFPDLNFVHIPKAAGDAFGAASAPLFPYGMGQFNAALAREVGWKKVQNGHECFFVQLPPMDVEPKVAKAVYGKSKIFCAVRNPYDRAISAACHHNEYEKMPTDNASLERQIHISLHEFESDRHRHSCFHIPQVDYLKGPYGCQHVLDFNHLERDFNQLMNESGYPFLTLPGRDETHKCTPRCKLHKNDLTPATRNLIKSVYAEDFAQLGPKFGWGE